ncbi:MAG: RNA methyltransferase [Tissierellia bacterium]|nr:RNA methyltransferase [Tissierellia bacterium]
MTKIITSSQNKKIKGLKTLWTVKGRKKEGKFLVEGPVVLQEVLPYQKPLELYIGEEEGPKYQNLIRDVRLLNIPITYVKSDLLKSVLPTEEPQGIVGIFSKIKVEEIIPQKGPILYLDGIRDPGNLGGIFRSANAFGVTKIYLSKDCVDIYNPKVIRSTMASLFRVPFEIIHGYKDLDKIMKSGYIGIGLDIEGSENFDFQGNEKILFVVGNEHHGISQELKGYLDKKIRIPMEREVESLNVNVATSICLYEYYKRKLRRSYE